MQSVHSQTIRRFALTALLTCLVLTAGAVNRLRSPRARMEAPPGMTYDSTLSSSMGMDVFRSHTDGLIIAIGMQQAADGVSAESLAKEFSLRGNGSYKSIAVTGRHTAYTGLGRNGRTFFAATDHPSDGNITVVLIVGDISQADAERYISTLSITS